MEIKSIENFLSKDGLNDFDCGNENLNDYLKKYARQNEFRQMSRTFLLVDKFVIIGYYTLTSSELDIDYLSPEDRKKLPKYPIPCIKIARIAVDKKYQSKGFGAMLLLDIMRKAILISEHVGVHLIIVEAKEEAIGFYEHYGFKRLETSDNILAISMSTILKIKG